MIMEIIKQIEERKYGLIKLKDNLIVELYDCDKEKRFEIIRKIENLIGAINEDDVLIRMERQNCED